MADKIFAKGLYYNLPHQNAPDFVKGGISINVSEFMAFLQANEKDGKVKLSLKVGKSGKGYAEVDTYVSPNAGQPYTPNNSIPDVIPQWNNEDGEPISADAICDGDVPF